MSEWINEFESSFETYVRTNLPASSMLHEAMKYSLLQGGKRLRPRFTLEAALLVGLPKPVAMHCAFALEIVHGFSLVHDDLPSMDNDDFRRGVPTTHRRFGEAQGLLAGDALLNFAYQTFLKCSRGTNPDAFTRAFEFFTEATHGMIMGQSEELSVGTQTLDSLLKIQSLKTGKLFHAAILCPLLLAAIGPANELFLECEEYAENFGFAFQIADDLDDAEQDEKQNVKNILSHLGREPAIELAKTRLLSSPVSDKFSATQLLLSRLQ